MMEVERERYLLPSNKMSEQKERKKETERERGKRPHQPATLQKRKLRYGKILFKKSRWGCTRSLFC
jgi:hypothetical protein